MTHLTNRRSFIKKISLGSLGVIFGLYFGRSYYNSISINDIDLANYKDLIIAVSDCIIPADETPGVIETGIYEYLLYIAEHVLTAEERVTLISGMLDLTSRSEDQFGLPFHQCKSNEQLNILIDLESETPNNQLLKKVQKKLFGKSFIEMITQLTIECYCTSEVGCKNFFQYDIIPVNYNASLDIDDKFPAWATK